MYYNKYLHATFLNLQIGRVAFNIISMRKNVILLKIFLTFLFLSAGFNLSAASKYGFEKKETQIYWNSLEEKENVNLYFSKATGKIPYIDLKEMLCHLYGADYCTGKADSNIYTIKRDNGTTVQINTKEKIIHFDDYDLFQKLKNAVTLLDIVINNTYIHHEPASFEMRGDTVDIEYGSFEIDIFIDEDKCLLPLQTFTDIFSMPSMGTILYNGSELFFVTSEFSMKDADGYTELGDKFYEPEPAQLDKNFASYNYREFVLNMQFNYGLRQLHGIEKFSTWFEQFGLDKELSSTNTADSDQGLLTICYKYLGDIHSAFMLLSPYTDHETTITVPVVNPSNYNFEKQWYESKEIRSKFFPKGVPGFQKVGNTAYITFDSFWIDYDRDYYEEPITYDERHAIYKDYPSSEVDTIGLIHLANQELILDPKIKNLVIDLSCNTGGSYDAAVFAACWLLGRPLIAIQNGITGCQSSTAYTADVDFDGECGGYFDSIYRKRIFLLVSASTFSCGNLLASIMADSGKATLIGSKTAGGACAVYLTSTASGTLLKTSSQWQFSTLKNGVFSDIDTGISPDYKLTETESFYNRSKKGLTGFIEKLY